MHDMIQDRVAQLKAQMQAAAEQLAFEQAAQLRDQVRALEKEDYERRICQLLGDEGLPPPLVPTDLDYARTTLVGYEAIAEREQLCREETIALSKARRCRDALKLAQEAEAGGIKLSETFAPRRLTELLDTLEAACTTASHAFQDEDNRLCISNYTAWRIANK